MLQAFIVLIAALSIPLMILNILGGVVAGIWLAILGEWGIIVLGIIFFFVSIGTLGFAIKPFTLLVAPVAYYAKKGKSAGMVCFATLSSFYILAVITLWCCGILFLFVRDATASNLIPSLLWSYGLAIGPWGFITGQDTRGGGSKDFAIIFTSLFAQIAYFITMILMLFIAISVPGAIKIFVGLMAMALPTQMTLVALIRKEMKADGLILEGYEGSVNSPCESNSASVEEPRLSEMEIRRGDSIVVKSGVSDPDFGTRLDGWRGRVAEVEEDMIDLAWDSVTLQEMGLEMIIRCENDNFDWKVMSLHVADVEPTKSRDTPADVERMAYALWDLALDDPRLHGEQED